MSRILDKLIILVLSIFAMYFSLQGDILLIFIYVAIILSCLNYYLINRDRDDFSMKPAGARETIAFIIELAVVALAVFFSPAMVLLPIIAYDITRSRNYIATAVAVAALINAFNSFGISTTTTNLSTMLVLFILMLIILAVMLSIKTERQQMMTEKYKNLRDNTEEKSRKLRSQNSELMNARDTEVYNAQLSERNRIAREIHDNVGHTLSRAILQMGALLAIHKEEPYHTELSEVRETLDTAMNNIRSSVHDLHDESIDVASSIEKLAEPLQSKYNVKMDLDIGDNMPRQIKYACIGITKECISNIMKHSQNTDVEIRLNEHPAMYQLIVHDFTPESASASSQPGSATNSSKSNSTHESSSKNGSSTDTAGVGMGLENIATRAESVNGTLNISTENGFRVFVSIPRQN